MAGSGKQGPHDTITADGNFMVQDGVGNVVAESTETASTSLGMDANTVTIGDDAATSFTPSGSEGVIAVTDDNAQGGVVHYKVSSTNATTSIGGTASLAVSTGSLSGTSGTDGNLTVSANDGDGKIYIENRTGGSRNVSYRILTHSSQS